MLKDNASIRYFHLSRNLMKSFMLIKVPLLSKSSVADFTVKWFVTSMNSNVVNKVPSLIEQTSAVVVFTNIISEISSTLFVELVAHWVLVLGDFGFLCFFHFEVFWFIKEIVFLLWVIFVAFVVITITIVLVRWGGDVVRL
jgi:hypothetical protein